MNNLLAPFRAVVLSSTFDSTTVRVYSTTNRVF
jgi:hypothetical protein